MSFEGTDQTMQVPERRKVPSSQSSDNILTNLRTSLVQTIDSWRSCKSRLHSGQGACSLHHSFLEWIPEEE
jgi:hypothetical protein